MRQELQPHLFCLIGKENDKVEKFNKIEYENALYFAENYNLLMKIDLGVKNNPLGDKNRRICRFCGNTMPEVSFKNIAHAIPQLVGNRSLITYYECDVCNEKFSRILEDHLGKYLGAWRTLAQIRGSSGIPSYKTHTSRIDVNEMLIIQRHNVDDKPILVEHAEAKEVEICTIRQPYIPVAVYKCFVKMALSIIPEVEMQYFKNTLDWICEENHAINSIQDLQAGFCFTPGPNPHKNITSYIYKRADKAQAGVPYMIYAITFNNFMYQVVLPFCERDKYLAGKKIKVPLFPVYQYEWGENQYSHINLSSIEVVENEELRMTMSYTEKKEIPPEQYNELVLPKKEPDSMIALRKNESKS